MKRIFGSLVIAASLLCGYGCADNGAPSAGNSVATAERNDPPGFPPGSGSPAQPAGAKSDMDSVAAYVKAEPLTMRELMEPLIREHGLPTLLSLVELELARQDARKHNVIVTKEDFQEEYRITLDKWFKDSDDSKLMNALDKAAKEKRDSDAEFIRNEIKLDREELLSQVLANKHMTRDEFDIWVQRNTYLRKIAEPLIGPEITKEAMQKAFGQMFGERIKVKYIELATMDEVTEARRRLAAGESFESVATMSHDGRTKDMGGELPLFTRANANVPDVFKEAAFNLKDGAISEVVVVGNWKDLIKRIAVIPPAHVKFETVKDDVYRTLHDSLMEAWIQKLERELAAQVRVDMKIADPVLARQFEEQLNGSAKAAKKAADDLARKRRLDAILKPPLATQPSTQPINETNPAATTVAPPAATEVGERPPATQGSK